MLSNGRRSSNTEYAAKEHSGDDLRVATTGLAKNNTR